MTVVVVNKQMTGVGLCCGRWTPEDPGRDDAVENAHGRITQTPRCTQVQGPREEVKPLHPACRTVYELYMRATIVLLELCL
jgi:hypothetical protein